MHGILYLFLCSIYQSFLMFVNGKILKIKIANAEKSQELPQH